MQDPNSITTEQSSNYDQLEYQDVYTLLSGINNEDLTVAESIKKELIAIEKLATNASDSLRNGGRLFYIGAGTSGRLGIVDASECPPTYGVPYGLVIGIIAGGDNAIRKAVEFAEDDTEQGWEDLKQHSISKKDIVIGISASGKTPYVAAALEKCKKEGIATGCICCNKNSTIGKIADHPVEVVVGPEFVTGSTRMKAGTAQKMVLNMISTTAMIQLGRVKGNKMVDMQLTNNKLVERGAKMVAEKTGLSIEEAKKLLLEHGSVRKAIEKHCDLI